jgi:hypothetical protein
MAKEQMRLKKSLLPKQRGGVSELGDLLDSVKRTEQEEALTRMNFEIPVALRNAFKAKVASQGKKVKDVFADFMRQYTESSDKK